MPGARWFDGAQVNYARQVLAPCRRRRMPRATRRSCCRRSDARGRAAAEIVVARSCARQVAALRRRRCSAWACGRGDRVCAYLPNTARRPWSFLACASVGAIWSICSPDMGPVAVLDRFRQIEPEGADRLRRLRATAASRTTGRGWWRELLDAAAQRARTWCCASLLSAGRLRRAGRRARHAARLWRAASLRRAPPVEPELAAVRPPAVGGLFRAAPPACPSRSCTATAASCSRRLKLAHAAQRHRRQRGATGDRFHWYSATGWIMWNCADRRACWAAPRSACSTATPAGRRRAPDWTTLWRFAALARPAFFGAGAASIASCLKAGVEPQGASPTCRPCARSARPARRWSDECYRWVCDHCPTGRRRATSG